MNEAPKVQMPRWNATISHTQQQTAGVIPCCTAITMQYNSYAMQFLYDEIKAEERCNKLQYSTVCRIS